MRKLKKCLVSLLACTSLCLGVVAFSSCGQASQDSNLESSSGIENVVFQGYKIENGSIYNYDEKGEKRKDCDFDGYHFDAEGK